MSHMNKKITRIGIACQKKLENPKVLESVMHCLIASKKEVFLLPHTKENLLHEHDELPYVEDLSKEDPLHLIIALGGDGTILRTVHRLSSFDTYLFGINAGHLGFLSEVQPDNLENTCLRIWDSVYTIDERMLLDIKIQKKDGKTISYHALNEVVVSQSAVARLIELPVTIGDQPLTVFRADGLIVATPTGSTAYNLSAGGPILHPRIEAIILTPIAPFSLSQKPLVIPAEKTITFEVTDCNRENMVLTIDGQETEPLHCGDKVTIAEHPKKVKFLRLPEESYFNTLREKLKWGERL